MKKMAEQQWTWKIPNSSDGIKRSMSRQDAYDKSSGQAIYTRRRIPARNALREDSDIALCACPHRER
jgi:hypothetical protein